MARLAISKGFLAEYVRLGKDLQRAVDQAIAAFARDSQPALHLEKPEYGHDDRIGIMPVNGHWRGVVLTPGDTSSEDTYSLVTVLPQDQVAAYVTDYLFSASRALEVLAACPEEANAEEAAGQPQPSPRTAPEAERLSVGASSPSPISPGADQPSLSAGGLLAREAGPEMPQPALPEAHKAELGPPASSVAVERVSGRSGQLVSGSTLSGPVAPDDLAAVVSEPYKVQRSLAQSISAWHTRRRSRRLARRCWP